MRPVAVLFVALAVAMAGCGGSSPVKSVTNAQHIENGVKVDIEVTVFGDGSGLVNADFIPATEKFHLYDTEMPIEGIDGFGRPTLLEIGSGASPTASTSASVDAFALSIEALGIEVPVYPDGPVRLTTPFEAADRVLDVRLTYMSCGTDGGCTIPVIDRSVPIELP